MGPQEVVGNWIQDGLPGSQPWAQLCLRVLCADPSSFEEAPRLPQGSGGAGRVPEDLVTQDGCVEKHRVNLGVLSPIAEGRRDRASAQRTS